MTAKLANWQALAALRTLKAKRKLDPCRPLRRTRLRWTLKLAHLEPFPDR